MLLSSGCSFTAGQYAENKIYERPYPILLAEKLNCRYFNFAKPGADNTFIHNNLFKYLFSFESYKLPKPEFITIQLSDYFRYLVFKRKESGLYIKPCSPLFKPLKRKQYLKLNNYGHEQITKEASATVVIQASKSTRRKEIYEDKILRRRQTNTDAVELGDKTQDESILRCLLMLNNLYTVCKALDIRLCIINYYGFGNWANDPLFQNLKTSFLIANPSVGLYNELCWLGFDRPDNFHFDEEAHQWQAETIESFFKNNTQLTVRYEKAPDYDQELVFDYRDEL